MKKFSYVYSLVLICHKVLGSRETGKVRPSTYLSDLRYRELCAYFRVAENPGI
jgi:hypothetical protein